MDKLPQFDPGRIIEEMAATFAARGADYSPGDVPGHEVHAQLLQLLWPQGIDFPDIETANRFVLFNFILGKVVRYGLLLNKGGHQDSIHDIAVYSAILDSYHERPKQ
jgi:hypothetical protein